MGRMASLRADTWAEGWCSNRPRTPSWTSGLSRRTRHLFRGAEPFWRRPQHAIQRTRSRGLLPSAARPPRDTSLRRSNRSSAAAPSRRRSRRLARALRRPPLAAGFSAAIPFRPCRPPRPAWRPGALLPLDRGGHPALPAFCLCRATGIPRATDRSRMAGILPASGPPPREVGHRIAQLRQKARPPRAVAPCKTPDSASTHPPPSALCPASASARHVPPSPPPSRWAAYPPPASASSPSPPTAFPLRPPSAAFREPAQAIAQRSAHDVAGEPAARLLLESSGKGGRSSACCRMPDSFREGSRRACRPAAPRRAHIP